jgi:hypothetical protein
MSNNEYTPHKWVIVKIYGENIETTYKIFACWYGGYAGSDSWQMNSGIRSAEKVGENWIFKGFSGSIYICNPQNYGLSLYCSGELEQIIEKSKKHGVTMWLMPPDLDWQKFDYE